MSYNTDVKRFALIGVVVLGMCVTAALQPLSVLASGVNPIGIVPPTSTASRIPEIQQHNDAMSAGATGKLNLDYFVDSNMTGMMATTACRLGPKFVSSNGCVSQSGQVTADSGLYDNVIGYISDIYRAKPASTETFVADVLNGMHVNIAQPAYAQGVGIGFASLTPILDVWKAFRNIAYLAFVIIFLVIGFMIMFRQKIGSQSVVTAQQALPRIVIALLLVTFSYAIAGLLIDAMYLIMFLLVALFQGSTKDPSYAINTGLINGNALTLAGQLIGGNAAGEAAAHVADFVNQGLGGGIAGAAAGIITGLTVALIVLILILFNAFRVLIGLLRVYIEIIIMIALAPVILMMEAIPGNNAFRSWLKSLFFNLMVFPAILLLVLIFFKIADASKTYPGVGFTPPYLGGASTASAVPFLAGLALILGMPEAIDQVKKLGGDVSGPFGAIMQAGLKNFTGTAKQAGRVVEAQPFALPGTDVGAPFRTRGRETAVERVLIGPRAERLRQIDAEQERAARGGREFDPTAIKAQGLYGAILGERQKRRTARTNVQTGAGSTQN